MHMASSAHGSSLPGSVLTANVIAPAFESNSGNVVIQLLRTGFPSGRMLCSFRFKNTGFSSFVLFLM